LGLSLAYDPAVTREDGIKMIRAAFDRGITFFEQPRLMILFLNEQLVGETVAPFRQRQLRNEVHLTTK